MTETIFSSAVIISILACVCLGWRRLWRAAEAANEADWGGKWLNRLDGLNRLFCKHYHRLQFEAPGLPETGAALVVSNHTSGLDPLLMAAAVRRPMRFMIAREEYQRFGFNWLFRAMGCIPVERERKPELALREALQNLRDGEVVALFPQGRIQLAHEPAIKLKRGVIKLAELSGCAIYPVRITGVKGQGQVLLAVLLRSRAIIRSFPPLMQASTGQLEILAALLSGTSKT